MASRALSQDEGSLARTASRCRRGSRRPKEDCFARISALPGYGPGYGPLCSTCLIVVGLGVRRRPHMDRRRKPARVAGAAPASPWVLSVCCRLGRCSRGLTPCGYPLAGPCRFLLSGACAGCRRLSASVVTPWPCPSGRWCVAYSTFCGALPVGPPALERCSSRTARAARRRAPQLSRVASLRLHGRPGAEDDEQHCLRSLRPRSVGGRSCRAFSDKGAGAGALVPLAQVFASGARALWRRHARALWPQARHRRRLRGWAPGPTDHSAPPRMSFTSRNRVHYSFRFCDTDSGS